MTLRGEQLDCVGIGRVGVDGGELAGQGDRLGILRPRGPVAGRQQGNVAVDLVGREFILPQPKLRGRSFQFAVPEVFLRGAPVRPCQAVRSLCDLPAPKSDSAFA